MSKEHENESMNPEQWLILTYAIENSSRMARFTIKSALDHDFNETVRTYLDTVIDTKEEEDGSIVDVTWGRLFGIHIDDDTLLVDQVDELIANAWNHCGRQEAVTFYDFNHTNLDSQK